MGTRDVVPLVECLPSKHEPSVPSRAPCKQGWVVHAHEHSTQKGAAEGSEVQGHLSTREFEGSPGYTRLSLKLKTKSEHLTGVPEVCRLSWCWRSCLHSPSSAFPTGSQPDFFSEQNTCHCAPSPPPLLLSPSLKFPLFSLTNSSSSCRPNVSFWD